MLKNSQVQRLMFLLAIAGLFAVTADFACLEDVCADLRTAEFRSLDTVMKYRIETLNEGLARSGVELTAEQRLTLARDGQLFGVVKLERPVKHPNGAIEMPTGWLPDVPEGHPWRAKLTPADDAFYSYVEERLIKARLFDPSNPDQLSMINAYLKKATSRSPEFVGWTYGSNRTECSKKVNDSGPGPGDATD
jgi:hypothetical protein